MATNFIGKSTKLVYLLLFIAITFPSGLNAGTPIGALTVQMILLYCVEVW